MSLLSLYNLHENVPQGATAVVGDWGEAEKYWPECSAEWDAMHQGEDVPADIYQIGPVLMASPTGSDEKYLWSPNDGKWAGIGTMRFQLMGAFIKFMAGPSGGAALYVPAGRKIPYIEVVGPTPDDLPGFTGFGERRNGKVSAQKKQPTAEDIRQAALAVQTYKQAVPPIG